MDIIEIKKLIKNSNNYSDVLRKLDLKTTNGNYETLKKIVSKFNIDVNHFNRKNYTKHNNTKLPLNEILKDNVSYNSTRLKNRILDESIKKHKCERCSNEKWLDNVIPLQLHHINGNRNDNRIENLQLLCPNCHVLTDNFGSKNMKVKRKHPMNDLLREKKYKDKEELLSWFNYGKTYSEVAKINKVNQSSLQRWVKYEGLQDEISKLLKQRKINDKGNEYDILLQALRETKSFIGAANKLKISDNGIRKKCKKYHIPIHKKDLLIWLENN